jgi:hypothetical protein
MSPIGVGTISRFGIDVLEPEHEVVGGEGIAVGPLHALRRVTRVDLPSALIATFFATTG